MYLVGIEKSTCRRIPQIECERGCGLPVADPVQQEQRPSRQAREGEAEKGKGPVDLFPAEPTEAAFTLLRPNPGFEETSGS